MDSPCSVIVNEHSHSGGNDADAVRAAFDKAGIAADVHVVHDPDTMDATIAAALAAAPGCIVAAGGDGTINAVARHAIEAGVTLGVLPMGTLNHFARDLGLPVDAADAAAVIAAGHVAEVDVGEVNGRLFLNNASLGLYASMVAHRERMRPQGPIAKWTAMVRASWYALWHAQAFSAVLHVDGRELHRRTPFVFIGNNDYVLQGPHAGERSSLDDGVLSVYVLHAHGPWRLLGLAVRALLGRPLGPDDFEAMATTSLVVESQKGHVRLARDGEVEMTESPVRFRVRPRALRVFVPHPEI